MAAGEPRYLPNRWPCFHCSKRLFLLKRGPHSGTYRGQALVVDGVERIFHAACVAPFLAGEDPEEGAGRRYCAG